MSGLGSVLSISKSAIAAQQYGLAVTGNNIANVNNPNYSLQNADQKNRDSILYAGYLFGTGVNTSQIEQNVNSLIENRLTDEISSQSAYQEAEAYMNILEGYFDVSSDSSVANILTDFWDSWYDLSDNPLGSSERVMVYEQGVNLAKRLNKTSDDIGNMETDISQEIDAAINLINSYSSQIADLNVQITGLEATQSANDLRDQRNALMDSVGQFIDIDTFEQPNGAVIVNGANGFPLVNGVDYYTLSEKGGQILWEGSYGADLDITENISGGKLAGWLEMRDEILPKVLSELDVLAKELIWGMNYQHTQGSGLEYLTGSVTGDYATDQSGRFSSYDFGDKIDYTQAFVMWMEDHTTVDTQYTKTQVDMNISQAKISNWERVAPGNDQYRYQLTVVDSATLGDKDVIQTDGLTLATVQSSDTDLATALNDALAAQTLTVSGGPSGTEVIEIKDTGGDAKRSAASIAQALSAIDGLDAYASEVSVAFDASGIAADQGDEVQFSLYVDGIVFDQKFTVTDTGVLSLDEQFENALRDTAKDINDIRGDQDLFASGVNGLTLTSSAGRTLGLQNFEVLENASIQLTNFNNFTTGDTLSFTVQSSGFGVSPDPTSTNISISLGPDIDPADGAAMATAFYDALHSGLADEPFAVEHDPFTNSVIVRTIDGSGLTIQDGGGATAGPAELDMTGFTGTAAPVPPGSLFVFDGSANVKAFAPVALDGGTIDFIGQGSPVSIAETSAAPGSIIAGVITGTVTLVTDPGMTVYSTVPGDGGLFNGNWGKPGNSIMTLGGEGGFDNFAAGQIIEFEVDGIPITVPITLVPPSTTEVDFATDLKAGLDAGFLAVSTTDYEVIQTGGSVSIVKKNIPDDPDPIEITKFVETNGGANISLGVKTGTGKGTSNPQNDLLETNNLFRDFSTASLYADEGIIKWEKYDADGLFTGQEGLITVEAEGRVSIVESDVETLSFDIDTGSLVAGNTLIINTDGTGIPDPLDFTVYGSANAQNETYQFRVVSGGKVAGLTGDEDPIIIEWKTDTGSGTIKLEGSDPPLPLGAPFEMEVDGMTVNFYDGTLFENDVFTITTNESGIPVSTNEEGNATGELSSDWHWTIDSFADQFNRQSEGMSASTTIYNQLKIEASEDYHAIANVEYSGSNGFNEENVSLAVTDWGAIDFAVNDLQFVRSPDPDGDWGMVNDPTGVAVFIPEGGDDDGFGIDFNGDGLVDLEISFAQKVSGAGSVQMDLERRDPNDIRFAFSDDSGASSGLLAAAGINTFFEGVDAGTIEINDLLADTKYIAGARIDSETGVISQGDNTNALAMGDVQYQDITMKRWTFDRESSPTSSLTSTTLNGYFNTMTGSIGIISSGIKTSREFADIMVDNLTEQRNAISAVSLDEEMIKLMEYQNAYSAASKLLTVVDEMMQTLINTI
jgi:flagellar hook-associated protein 1 FlgK